MAKIIRFITLVMAFVSAFGLGYIKGMEVPQIVVDDYTIMTTYVSEEFGDGYRGELNDENISDNKCEFDVFTSSGTYLTHTSVERYSK